MTRALVWGMGRYGLMKGGDEGECEKKYEPDRRERDRWKSVGAEEKTARQWLEGSETQQAESDNKQQNSLLQHIWHANQFAHLLHIRNH